MSEEKPVRVLPRLYHLASEEHEAEFNALTARLEAAEKERDLARQAILSFGNGNDFDWEVLEKLDTLQADNTRLREGLEANAVTMLDLSLLVRRLCNPRKSKDLKDKAMDYLKRKDLLGSILRDS